MRVITFIASFFVFAFLIGANAHAQNTSGVHGPNVDADDRSWQYRITVDPDGGPGGDLGFRQRLHYQQAVNGNLRWRILGQTRKRADNDLDFDFIRGELLWQVTEDDADYSSGFRFEVAVRDANRPFNFNTHWTNQWSLADGWRLRAIAIGGFDFGDNAADGIDLETRASLTRKLSNGHRAGIEMFNGYGRTDSLGDFNSQDHQIGPSYSIPMGEGWDLYGGILFGVSDGASDNQFRLWINKSLE